MICHVFSNSAVAPDSRLSQRTNEWSHWETLVYDKLGIKSIRLNNTTFANQGELCQTRRRENNGKGKEGDQKKKYLHKSDTDTDEEESPPPPGNDPFLSQEKEQPGDFISDDQSELGDSIPDDQHEPREDSSSHEHTEPGDFFPLRSIRLPSSSISHWDFISKWDERRRYSSYGERSKTNLGKTFSPTITMNKFEKDLPLKGDTKTKIFTDLPLKGDTEEKIDDRVLLPLEDEFDEHELREDSSSHDKTNLRENILPHDQPEIVSRSKIPGR